MKAACIEASAENLNSLEAVTSQDVGHQGRLVSFQFKGTFLRKLEFGSRRLKSLVSDPHLAGTGGLKPGRSIYGANSYHTVHRLGVSRDGLNRSNRKGRHNGPKNET